MGSEILRTAVAPIIYIVSTMFFVFGLKRLTKVKTARQGNIISGIGMLLAVIGSLLELGFIDYRWILAGLVVGAVIGAMFAVRVAMTEMPELVALLNGLGGAASALVGLSVIWSRVLELGSTGTLAESLNAADAVTIALSVLIGALTLTGSIIALLKLQGRLKNGQPILLPARHALNGMLVVGVVGLGAAQGFMTTGDDLVIVTLVLTGVACLLGILLVIPIGGADMPVVVSLLNSYSGLAAAMAGFVVGNPLLIVAGATVGAAGIILTQIMCVAMNRSLLNVLVGGFGVDDSGGGGGGKTEYTNVRSTGAEEAALMLEGAATTIFVPGYGLAVAQAQHIVRELADEITRRGGKVSYAIHPVAGRMPGHMNVLLAEADVPYEQLIEMDQINSEFKNTDVVVVVGANDVVNPVAAKDPSSPIFGMPILNAHEARSVFVIKRSLGSGYAGIKNELFEYPNTMMLFGDAKQMLQEMVKELKAL
jgi:H+-translocating NAD(P) transhydrogenase subunit beta